MAPFVLLFVVTLLGAISFAVWWEILRRRLAGLPVLPFRERAAVHWSPLLLFAAGSWLLFQVLSQVYLLVRPFFLEVETVEPTLNAIQASCLINVLVFSFLLILLSEAGARRLSEFGITLNNWPQEVSYGIQGFFASLLPVYIVLIASIPLRSTETQHSFLKMLRESPDPVTIGWVTLAAIVIAPLAEELVFRAIFQGYLQSRFSPKVAIGVSSVVFAGVHGFPDALALVPLALVLGYVYYCRHSFLAVVLLHGAFNLLNLVVLLLTPSQEQPEPLSWIFR